MSQGNKYPPFLKYSSLAFQMIGIMLVFTWLGKKADAYFNFSFPLLTILFSLLALFGLLYKLVKDFSKKP